jgi:hypothetical protein
VAAPKEAFASYTRVHRERSDMVDALIQADMAVLLAAEVLSNACSDLRAADPRAAIPFTSSSDDGYKVTGVWLPCLLKQVSYKLDLPPKTVADAALAVKTEEA